MVEYRIRNYCKEHGISLEELEAKAELTTPARQALRSRGLDSVSYYKICKTLGVKLETFFRE